MSTSVPSEQPWSRVSESAERPTVERSSAVKSAARTLDILELLASDGALRSIAMIARELGLPKTSVHGIVHTLADRGWLQPDASGTRYGLGLRSLLAGTAYLDTDDVVTLSREVLDRVAERTGETVHLGRLDGVDVVYLAKRESVHPLRLYSAVGRRLPAHATALGKALLARMTQAELDDVLRTDTLAALTDRTITDRGELDRALDAVRADGIAVDRGENSPGIVCYAAAFPAGVSAAALSCSLPESRLTDAHRQEIVDALQEAARTMTAMLGRIAR